MDETTDKDNGSNKDVKRDEKGRFLPGYSVPGAGRKKVEPLSLEEIGEHLEKILKQNKDPKIKLKAATVLLSLKKQLVSSEPVTVNPELAALQAHIAGGLFGDDEGVTEVDENFFDD